MKKIQNILNKYSLKYFSILSAIVVIIGCEKEVKIKNQDVRDAVVVEGHIENGIPPYVLLTKNKSYYGNVNINDLDAYFVHGANIMVITDDDSVQLVEYNAAIIRTLPDSVAVALAAQFGINISAAADFPAISIYTVPVTDVDFVGVFAKRYDLRIETDGKLITSTTTIPTPTFFDSLWIESHPNPNYAADYFIFRGRLPVVTTYNFRVFTKADGEAYRVDDVYTEEFFTGGKINFSILKGSPVGASFDPDADFNTRGYWNTAEDSVCTVKISTLDKAHYEFWHTVEENRQSQGNPFASLVYVKSNINGGLGIWGGYGSITASYNRFP
jgi:hypothetical protein